MALNLTAVSSFIQIERDNVIVNLIPKGALSIGTQSGRLVLSAPHHDFHEELMPGEQELEIGGISAGTTLADWLGMLADTPDFNSGAGGGGSLTPISTPLGDGVASSFLVARGHAPLVREMGTGRVWLVAISLENPSQYRITFSFVPTTGRFVYEAVN